MSNKTAPKGSSVMQANTSIAAQTARAVNMESPGTGSAASNTSIVDQSNLQIGFTGTDLNFVVFQTNDNTEEQSALAMNFDSPNATATATNNNITHQANGFMAGGVAHDG